MRKIQNLDWVMFSVHLVSFQIFYPDLVLVRYDIFFEMTFLVLFPCFFIYIPLDN
jgi:hypothetical protein